MENFNSEEIKVTYDKYFNLLRKFFPENGDAVEKLEAEMGERLFLAPRDTHPFQGGVPGGIISFSLDVAKHSKIFGDFVDIKKLVRIALLHELGKLGGPASGQDLFIPEDSSWHREKLGKAYKFNDACPKMSTAHRTLFYVARYGFQLDEEEWIALVTSAGFQYDENRFYANEVLPLAGALQICRTFAFSKMKKVP